MPSEQKIHICHIIYALKTGGLENGLVNLVNNLSTDKFSHSIVCLTGYDDFSMRIDRNDVKIISLYKKKGQDFGMYLKLFRVLRRLNPDVVHTRNMAAIESQIPAFLAGIKVRVHGEHGWDISDPKGQNKKYQWIRKVCNTFIHRFIPLSKELESYLQEVIHVPNRKITRICNGVDSVKFLPNPSTEKNLLPSYIAPNAVVIGCVGRMEIIKNPENLAKAFIALNEKGVENICLMMIGEGSQLKKVKKLITDKQLIEKCWFPGDCSNVAELMRNFDIFCLPSKAEGISNTLLEAMATGLPVVATKVGGNADIAVENETALLVESDDASALTNALETYINDKALRERHGQAARHRIEQSLSLKQMVLNYETMYLRETSNLHQEVA